MEARAQIENLLARYCRTYDDGDLEAYAALFRHGAILGTDGSPMSSYEDIERFHREHVFFYDGEPRTRHVITNIEIEVDEAAGTGTGSCYAIVYQALPDFPLQAIFIGSYHDKYHRVGDEWHFLERRFDLHLMGDASRHGRRP